MRFAFLGSGSQGNALVIESGATRVLLDCGFGLAETSARLGRLGLLPSDLAGIVVTHEHEDHIGGVARLARRHALPVWLTHGTMNGFESLFAEVEQVNVIEGYQLRPDLVHQFMLENPKAKLRPVFLYKLDEEAIVSGFKANAEAKYDWVLKYTKEPETFSKIARMISCSGRLILEQTEECGFPAFNTEADFNGVLSKVQDYLIRE